MLSCLAQFVNRALLRIEPAPPPAGVPRLAQSPAPRSSVARTGRGRAIALRRTERVRDQDELQSASHPHLRRSLLAPSAPLYRAAPSHARDQPPPANAKVA